VIEKTGLELNGSDSFYRLNSVDLIMAGIEKLIYKKQKLQAILQFVNV